MFLYLSRLGLGSIHDFLNTGARALTSVKSALIYLHERQCGLVSISYGNFLLAVFFPH